MILDVMFPENSSAGFELARDMRQGHRETRRHPHPHADRRELEVPDRFLRAGH